MSVFLLVRFFLGTKESFVAYSSDGITFTKKERIRSFFNIATGTVWRDGTIALYGEDFSRIIPITDYESGHRIWDLGLLVSRDGTRFERSPLSFKNLDKDIRGCDATIVTLPSGGYRLYFGENSDKELFSAISENGFDFTFEGKIDDLHLADSEVIYEKQAKKYYLFGRSNAPGELLVWESTDGRHFSSRDSITAPFNVHFTILDLGESYLAYGAPYFRTGVGGIPNDKSFDFRYPIKARSSDGLRWEWSGEILKGPWRGNRSLVGASFVTKDPKSGGYLFFWTAN